MFQFQYDYTLEDMNALSRVSAKTYRRKKALVYRTIMTLLGIAYLALGIYALAHRSWIMGTIFFAAGAFFGAAAVFYHQGTAWRSRRMMVEGEGVFTVDLEEDSIRGKSAKGEGSYLYSAVIGAYHYKERYFLFLDKRYALLLPERGLTQGDPAELKEFLSEKLGKEVKELI